MRHSIILILTFLISFSAQSAPLNFGDTVPDWTLEDNQGESINYYKQTENKVSVILFWATWCPYCASLMPHLEVVYRKYRSKGVKLYAINVYEDGKIDPIEYFKKHKYSYTQLLTGDLLAEDFGVKGTPALYVVDKEKKVIYKRPSGVSDILVKQNVDLKIKGALAKKINHN